MGAALEVVFRKYMNPALEVHRLIELCLGNIASSYDLSLLMTSYEFFEFLSSDDFQRRWKFTG